MPQYQISINDNKFHIINLIDHISLSDSYVKNKIGRGNGEAKLYIGNENNFINDFFENFNLNCFFCKSDFITYLDDAKEEFNSPTQQYTNSDILKRNFSNMESIINNSSKDILSFKLIRANVNPPRVYVRSEPDYFNYLRTIGLPNLSHISILKIRDQNNEPFLYFRIFFDGNKENYPIYTNLVENNINLIQSNNNISQTEKQTLINARVGQGKYRLDLLKSCGNICPFTQIDETKLLIASHIKPWVVCNNKERLDHNNGFIFTPTYDRLFDQGLITFSEDKRLFISPWLSERNQKILKIFDGKIIENLPITCERLNYLNYHRENIFKSIN